MLKPAINRDIVSGEALFILRNLRENGRLGRSNKLADVKAALEPSVSLEFDSYFFFLRKFHYIAMDREAQLKLTDQGERVVSGELQDRFTVEVGEFFADQLVGEEEESTMAVNPDDLGGFLPPPPPELTLDDSEVDRTGSPPPLPSAAIPLPPAAVPLPPAAVALPPARASRTALPSVDAPLPSYSAPVAARPEPPVPESRREVSPVPAPLPLPPASSPSSVSSSMPPPVSPSASPATASKGAELDMRYQKFDPLGSGPLGTVFKGRFNALGLDVCIKELKDIFGYFSFLQRGEVLKRLKKELCAQAQVRHPSIVEILDQNVDSARPYFVLQLLRTSLREKLEAGGGKGVAVSLALRCFLQLAYGLRAAHAAGLHHHNLKPENVLFDDYGNARLADFGMGRVIEVDATKGMPQVFMGTGGMVYMAPELINRSKDAGASADVYGLGILLYEMFTGQIPGRRSPLPSEVNPEAPSGLDAIFDKMTQDKKDQRYPDIDAMLEDLYKAFPEREFLEKGDLVLSSEPQRA
ncbi:serine/threonine-protein kinase [Stigmatella aurantiaca]|uniref:Pkn10, putative n=1 Tax=Stigmatella aurantiaca (strain DW4/3-1) TaxID=378806 RepID=Q092T3_STIAD|nr:serine/threonine-protein kinase [Stigmatella aurantiaca]ADO69452.1 Serine-threonine protein kinase [Stigmatella aurantiaca DW4/3-1]EAU66744.1 Pkn10, putative [Stigmatella aurantiaca DW4/3-1]